jgi:hypothetical protein
MTDFPRFDPGTLYNSIWSVVEKWVPKHGDFLLDDNGMLWVNKGWEAVCAEAPE